eukprot:TRINITY_DN15441_c0_g3_i2.p1 TRINITY_DN15441_c0_g3~~TRINITY_DN15441_c0_g3_i2.p1  ORF type:complete len:128 (-),score=17.28 TRINITY_DN15441_c0_g3_i2:557-940(-)
MREESQPSIYSSNPMAGMKSQKASNPFENWRPNENFETLCSKPFFQSHYYVSSSLPTVSSPSSSLLFIHFHLGSIDLVARARRKETERFSLLFSPSSSPFDLVAGLSSDPGSVGGYAWLPFSLPHLL